MFDIQTQLFESQDIRFGPIDHEKDPEIESKWTHDSEFMRLMETGPARPMSAALVRKQYEKLEKQIEEEKKKQTAVVMLSVRFVVASEVTRRPVDVLGPDLIMW